MADKRINLCRVLLSVILCAVFVSVNTAESYARYENSFSFKTVLVPGESSPVESDLLALSTDAPQTVIVGEISSAEKTKTVSFVLKSLGDSAKGTFSLTNEHGNYINVSASTDSSVLEHGTVFVLISEHARMIAVRKLLQTGAHRLSLRAGAEHLLHQPVDLILRKRHEPLGALRSALLLADLCIIVVADAVGPAAGLPGDLLKDGLERQPLLLGLLRRLPQEITFKIAPTRPLAHPGNCLLHSIPSKNLSGTEYARNVLTIY